MDNIFKIQIGIKNKGIIDTVQSNEKQQMNDKLKKDQVSQNIDFGKEGNNYDKDLSQKLDDNEDDVNQNVEIHSEDELEDKKYPFMCLFEVVKMPRKIKQNKRIVFDTSETIYRVIKSQGSKQMGWTVVSSSPTNREDWNISWYDTYISEEVLRKLLPYQKINHFPGSFNLGKKNYLAQNLTKMRRQIEPEYSFFPRTWTLPLQYDEFKRYLYFMHDNHSNLRNIQIIFYHFGISQYLTFIQEDQNREIEGDQSNFQGIYLFQLFIDQRYNENIKTKKPYYIVKPESSCQGKGIYLTKKVESFSYSDHCVIQEYIKNPFLIDGLKFDFRIYVLIKNINPLKIFMYPEGLARFATVKYSKPNKKNSSNFTMHLTNYAVNKKSPNFVFNQNENNDDIGHKRSFSSVLKVRSILQLKHI